MPLEKSTDVTVASKMSSEKLIMLVTSEVQRRLPAELRNLIYEELVDEEFIESVVQQSNMPLNSYPLPNSLDTVPDEKQVKNHVDIASYYPELAAEVLSIVFNKYKGLRVNDIALIGEFLTADFYGVGMTPAKSTISAFEVRINSQKDDVSTLETTFQPIIDAKQKWSTNFELTVMIEYTSDRLYGSVSWTADCFMDSIQALKPVRKAAEGRGAKVAVVAVMLCGRVKEAVLVSDLFDSPKKSWESIVMNLFIEVHDPGYHSDQGPILGQFELANDNEEQMYKDIYGDSDSEEEESSDDEALIRDDGGEEEDTAEEEDSEYDSDGEVSDDIELGVDEEGEGDIDA